VADEVAPTAECWEETAHAWRERWRSGSLGTAAGVRTQHESIARRRVSRGVLRWRSGQRAGGGEQAGNSG
jgi:hypothetical protein